MTACTFFFGLAAFTLGFEETGRLRSKSKTDFELDIEFYFWPSKYPMLDEMVSDALRHDETKPTD
jgi:hypothetical protein